MAVVVQRDACEEFLEIDPEPLLVAARACAARHRSPCNLARASTLTKACTCQTSARLEPDPIRRPRPDRGAEKNFLNDLQGAVGELAAYERLRPGVSTGELALRHSLVDFRGPADDVDFAVQSAR